MAEHDESVEIMDEDEIVTLYDDNGEPIDFYEVACVEYEGDFYALLEPVEEMEGVEEGEVFIFKVEESENEDEEDKFIPLEDEALMDAVFEEYLRVAEEEGCGCDCDECGHHDHCHDDDCDCE